MIDMEIDDDHQATRFSLLKSRKAIVAGAILFVLAGAAAPFLWNSIAKPESEEENQTAPTARVKHVAPAPPPVPPKPKVRLNDRDQADEHFLEHDFTGALRLYVRLPAEQQSDMITYKIAACHELSSNWMEAMKIYQRLIETSADQAIVAAATLGKVRALIGSQNIAEAKHESYRLLLSAGDNEPLSSNVYHLLAYVATVDAYGLEQNLLDEGIRISYQIPSAERLIDFATKFVVAEEQPAEAVVVLDRISSSPQDIHLQVRVHEKPLAELLKQIAGLANLPISSSPAALATLEKRVITCNASDIDAATFLDAALEASGLSWYELPRGVGIRLQREITASKLTEAKKNGARRIATKATTLYSDSWLQDQTRLCLGDIAFWDSDYDDAEVNFQQITRQTVDSRIRKAAWFNLAKVYWVTDRSDECRKAFERVVDETMGSPLEPIAYYFLGVLDLTDFRPLQASKMFGRSLALSNDTELSARSAIYLATAYLMSDNPLAANKTLKKYRKAASIPRWNDSAVLVNAIARFRAAITRDQRTNEGRDLIAALSNADPRRFAETIGFYLVGTAFDELGYTSQARAVFDEGRQIQNDELARRMTYRLYEIAHKEERWGDAKRYLETLMNSERPDWRFRAHVDFARVRLEEGNYESAIRTALRVLPEASPSRRATLLNLAGQAYERLAVREETRSNGDPRVAQKYRRFAAQCFAGLLPVNDDTAETATLLKGMGLR